MLHTLWPRAVDRTEVTCEWFFEPETMARADFDPSDAVDFWDTVNRQDWYVCELTQRGVRTKGYTAGRYSGRRGRRPPLRHAGRGSLHGGPQRDGDETLTWFPSATPNGPAEADAKRSIPPG